MRVARGAQRPSNHRLIAGAKWFVLLNQEGLIVRVSCSAANSHDTIFHPFIQGLEHQMIVLCDQSFHATQGDSQNLKICRRGQWNERMLIETLFSLCVLVVRAGA